MKSDRSRAASALLPDPLKLAARQIQRDREATRRFEGLYEHKRERMLVSPLAYLRGTAPLFYEALRESAWFREGPPGRGVLCGDAHVENFGVYRVDRPDRGSGGDRCAFDLNDFDEAFDGPFRIDVLRLMTSVLLGARDTHLSGSKSIEACKGLLDAYVGALSGKAVSPPPDPVDRLLLRAETRTRKEFLEKRTTRVGDSRKFELGPRYLSLEARAASEARAAFERYASKIADVDSRSFEVLDVAYRIAGTGSLGVYRIAVLTRGRGGPDGAWIFDMKEARPPSSGALREGADRHPGKRVISAMRACLAEPPIMAKVTSAGKKELVVRRLAPQEDKLDWTRVESSRIGPLVAYFGALLGRAHLRGREKLPKKPWSKAERAALLERAIVMAGIHEAAYLAFCRDGG